MGMMLAKLVYRQEPTLRTVKSLERAVAGNYSVYRDDVLPDRVVLYIVGQWRRIGVH